MSNPKFLVFKLKDLKIPVLIILVAILLLIFLLFRNKASAQTFAPADTYQDGQYIAGISLSDTTMDLVVQVTDGQITSVSLTDLSNDSTSLYDDLVASIDYVNTYVTATQSTELPANATTSPATNMLMDAVKVALSDDANAQVLSTYEKLDISNQDDIFVDEFSDEDYTQNTESNSADSSTSNDEAAEITPTDTDVSSSADSSLTDSAPTSIMEEDIVE
ncbi:hypothetical protein [Cellulosilyticum ruminicola]|uniref:hypothetical protein n=1 Tax=Cellulosilyticum ruminicola TaxID=425254 RepID=UPI0006D2C3FC|nr:hypothetical protein [Cellulosilyticum ruminicola]